MVQTTPNNPSILTTITMKAISSDSKAQIISLLSSGLSVRQTATQTHHSIGLISKILSEHFPDSRRAAGGHPRKVTPASTSMFSALAGQRMLSRCPGSSGTSPHTCLTQDSEESSQTGQLKAAVKEKKDLLTAGHRKGRLNQAIAHQDWTVDDWKRVIWSDETKINRLGSDGRVWGWKLPGEGLTDRLVQGTQKYGGGSVMVWGCMSWDGIGYSCRMDGRMDGDLYIQILEDELMLSIEHLGKTPSQVIFQQDNDPKHTCKKAKDWFKNHQINVMPWPAQSPDLNPIEHLWQHLKKRLGGHPTRPGGILELWGWVEKEWEAIPQSICRDLVESMPMKVAAVIEAKRAT